MSDPAIKLFGKTIALPLPSEEGGGEDNNKINFGFQESATKETITQSKDQDRETGPGNGDALPSTAQERDEENRPEKKPDKILPCPRCSSTDTKFCYFNNYNVGQPRHFCRNCQRYWTAGGTMRNVPVGAGRRKNKNSIHYPALRADGAVLTFGSNAGLRKSMAYTLPPFYPSAAYWGCGSNLSIPWISLGSGPHSPTLGKRSRDGNVLSEAGNSSSNKQGNLWISKRLRIDDPEEVAKSSISVTVGFKNDKSYRGGLFREFNNHKVEAKSQVLLANPSAFSRSISFQESS